MNALVSQSKNGRGSAPRRARGFTLIELTLVVAILGILLAVAIPAYQDYTIRAKVAEGIALASPLQEAVEDYYARWGEMPADNAAAGVAAPEGLRGEHVASMTIRGGAIVVRYSLKDPVPAGATVVLSPLWREDGTPAPLLWRCEAKAAPDGYVLALAAEKSSMPARYTSSVCRW